MKIVARGGMDVNGLSERKIAVILGGWPDGEAPLPFCDARGLPGMSSPHCLGRLDPDAV